MIENNEEHKMQKQNGEIKVMKSIYPFRLWERLDTLRSTSSFQLSLLDFKVHVYISSLCQSWGLFYISYEVSLHI